jgi:heme/copper-type cytochrome/quinol oxidase subunit 4
MQYSSHGCSQVRSRVSCNSFKARFSSVSVSLTLRPFWRVLARSETNSGCARALAPSLCSSFLDFTLHLFFSCRHTNPKTRSPVTLTTFPHTVILIVLVTVRVLWPRFRFLRTSSPCQPPTSYPCNRARPVGLYSSGPPYLFGTSTFRADSVNEQAQGWAAHISDRVLTAD